MLCPLYGSDHIPRRAGFFDQKIDSLNFKLPYKFVKENGYPNRDLLSEHYLKQAMC
jgi:hypothetical protein